MKDTRERGERREKDVIYKGQERGLPFCVTSATTVVEIFFRTLHAFMVNREARERKRLRRGKRVALPASAPGIPHPVGEDNVARESL